MFLVLLNIAMSIHFMLSVAVFTLQQQNCDTDFMAPKPKNP